jgi:hypothetical protein
LAVAGDEGAGLTGQGEGQDEGEEGEFHRGKGVTRWGWECSGTREHRTSIGNAPHPRPLPRPIATNGYRPGGRPWEREGAGR